MSTGTKTGAKRPKTVASSEPPPQPLPEAEELPLQPPAKKNKSGGSSSQQTTKTALEACAAKEASSVAKASASQDHQTSANPANSSKNDDAFKRNYTLTVQESYQGHLNVDDNSLNKPGSVVFALSLLQSKFTLGATTTTPKRDGDEEFRLNCVEPLIEKLVASAKPQLREALKFIISAAKSDITSQECCCEGGAFPVLQNIKIKVLNRMIAFLPFNWQPKPGKHISGKRTDSYFEAVKQINMMLLVHPLFRFKDENAQEEYVREYMDVVYNALLEEIERIKADRRDEINRQNEVTLTEIKSLEEEVLKLQSIKQQKEKFAEETDGHIKLALEKIKNAMGAHEKMEAALVQLTTCMDCESSQVAYENMKEKSKQDLQSFVDRQNTTISEMETQKKKIEEETQAGDAQTQQHEETISRLRAMVGDKEEISKIELETGESVIKSQIREGFDSYVKVFEPVIKCIESHPDAKKGLVNILKQITESDEVIQEGILAMRSSIESFLEKSISNARRINEELHPPPPIPNRDHLLSM